MTDNPADLTRRRLLTAAGLAPFALGAGRAFAQRAEGQPMPAGVSLPERPGERMRWAIVGLGSFASARSFPASATHGSHA
jgi:hypothetical protein